MKRLIALLLLVGMITVTTVGCGGTPTTKAAPAPGGKTGGTGTTTGGGETKPK